jgi:hypothetical protein
MSPAAEALVPVQDAAELSDDDVVSPGAPGTRSTYLEPWMRRVREVDDATLDDLLATLVNLRRIKLGLGALGFFGGMFSLGILPLESWLHMVLIYGTLAMLGTLPAMGIGSLAVRRLFLKDARSRGLSASAAMLVLTRANRKARHMLPVLGTETQVERLHEAVRDWDRA